MCEVQFPSEADTINAPDLEIRMQSHEEIKWLPKDTASKNENWI